MALRQKRMDSSADNKLLALSGNKEDDDRIKPRGGGYLSRFFANETPDEDGMFSGIVIPKRQANFLWVLAWLSLVSGLYAISRGYYDLAPVPLGVWATSLLYWQHPDFSWRRYFDMAFVHLAMVYQIWRAVGAENMNAYYATLAVACVFFPLGTYFHARKMQWPSTICHGGVHVMGNVSNFVLYSGNVVSILSYK